MRVASLFAGCGGSSLGYRRAGLDVCYSVEIDALARDVYRMNMPDTTLSEDVLDPTCASRILEACAGPPDILDGSPPCKDDSFLGGRDPDGRNAALYLEFVRLVGEIRPRAFVAENVVAFARGERRRARRFLPIIAALKAHGYAVQPLKLDASWYGVPQARERMIVIGLREDLGVPVRQAFPWEQPRRRTIADALPEVLRIIAQPAKHYRGLRQERTWHRSEPLATVTCGGLAERNRQDLLIETLEGELRPLTAGDVRALSGFPETFRMPAGISLDSAWRLFGNAVPPPVTAAIGAALLAAIG